MHFLVSLLGLPQYFTFFSAFLSGIYTPKGITVPNPIQTICTRWGSDPLSYGSYSHVRVGSSGSDYDILAENVANRLFFAGEATTRQHPATMHGAFLSGLREASCILDASRRYQINSRKQMAKNIGPNHEVLIDLFKRPDLAFGRFSFVFNPLTEDPKAMGIMRISVGNSRSEYSGEEETENSGQNSSDLPLQLYTMVSREQAHQLQLIVEDASRLSFLLKDLGLKLMGPSSLGSIGNSLASSIASARRGKGRYRFSSKHDFRSMH